MITTPLRRSGYRPLPLLLALLLLPVAVLTSACSMEDGRDECCEEVRLIYRYVPMLRDEFPDVMDEIHHYLFDDQGVFLREVEETAPMSQVIRFRGKDLKVGRYTMLTIANRTDRFSHFPKLVPGETKLSDLTLRADYGVHQKSLDGDPLYWNIRDFEAKARQRLTYYCDMSNIHCELTIRVVWGKIFPPGADGYELELDYLPEQYDIHRPVYLDMVTKSLDEPDPSLGSTARQAWQEFPLHRGDAGRIRIPVTLSGHEIRHTFRSLRYTRDHIPTLRIYHGGKLYRKELDLTRFFRDQGLHPDSDPVQRYRIVVEINESDIRLHLWVGGRIVDWQDGGTLSGTVA